MRSCMGRVQVLAFFLLTVRVVFDDNGVGGRTLFARPGANSFGVYALTATRSTTPLARTWL